MREMLKFSVCVEMIFTEVPFIERIAKIKECGLGAFEFWNWRQKNIDDILREKKKYNLELAAFCVEPEVRIVDSARKEEFLQGLKNSIAVAHKLNCKALIVTTGNEMENLSQDAQHKNIVNCLKSAVPIVEKEKITLVLEPLNTLVNHKGYYLTSSKEGFDIIREVNSKNIRLLFDIYHQQISEGNLTQNIINNIDLIGHFHIADVPGRHEPGTGEINYGNLLKRIEETGYNGYIGLEFKALGSTEDILKELVRLSLRGRRK